jgi:serine/threonine protein kinase
MLCGYLPFDCKGEETVHELHQKIIDGNYTYPEGISDICRNLIDRILEKDPMKRLSIEQILQHSWCRSSIESKPISNIITYQHSKENVQGGEVKETLIPCDTTITPFLYQMFEDDLEKELQSTGLLDIMNFEEKDEDSEVFRIHIGYEF